MEFYNRFPGALYTNYELFSTLSCNYSCKYCIKKSMHELYKIDNYLDLSSFDLFSKYYFDYIVLSGGETFYDLERLNYILNIIPRSTKVIILTNGSLKDSIKNILDNYNNVNPVITVTLNGDDNSHNMNNYSYNKRCDMKLLIDPYNIDGIEDVDFSKFSYLALKSNKYLIHEGQNITDESERISFLKSPLFKYLESHYDIYLKYFNTNYIKNEYIYGVTCGPLSYTLCGHVQCYDSKFTSMNFMDLANYSESIYKNMNKHTLYPDMALLELNKDFNNIVEQAKIQKAFNDEVNNINITSQNILECSCDYYGYIKSDDYQNFQLNNFKYYANAFNLNPNYYFDVTNFNNRITISNGKNNIYRIPFTNIDELFKNYINDYDLVIVEYYPYVLVGRKLFIKKFLENPFKYRFPSSINTKLAYKMLNLLGVKNGI